MILPESTYKKIPELILSPMGVATHEGITDTGDFIPKKRITHDLSFPGKTSNNSVNSRGTITVTGTMHVCTCTPLHNPLHSNLTPRISDYQNLDKKRRFQISI